MEWMSLLGLGACAPDPEFRASLPFPAHDIDRGVMPSALRRRASQAILMAFTAANLACRHARREPSKMPVVFASVAGEIQVTDPLCIELAKPDGVISPTAFHNSVHNTAAGYWSIAQCCTEATTAMAAGLDTFAMALLEAWIQLACHGGEILLVCYDEQWPAYLASPMGKPAFASAMVLAAGTAENGILQIGQPYRGTEALPHPLESLISNMPVLAAIPLLSLAADGGEAQNILVSSHWQVGVTPYSLITTKLDNV